MQELMANISVVIPLGPEPKHSKHLTECLESIHAQTEWPDEILIVNDMHRPLNLKPSFIPIREYISPWHLGVAHAFNFGVALATHGFVIMMGADDKLLPKCVEQSKAAIRLVKDPGSTYFWYGVEYSDEREDQYLPCGAAMVSKALWQTTGGFPPESAVGASDCAYNSIFGYGHKYRGLVQYYCVNENEPLYYYRVSTHSDTADKGGAWQGPILAVRDILTSQYELPKWGRYE